jgi:hypothetical protein
MYRNYLLIALRNFKTPETFFIAEYFWTGLRTSQRHAYIFIRKR